MPNRYEQVLFTYLRQWPFWLYLAAWGAMIVLLDVVPEWFARPMVFVFLSLAAPGPAAVIGQVKQQIADARASLTPNFRTPHVIVAAALCLGAIVAMPLLTHRLLGISALGLIASVALASAAFAILAYFQSVTAIFIALGGAALLLLEPLRDAGDAMLTGRANGLAVAALAFAAAILGYIFYRLSILHEGMSEYGRILGDRSDYAWSDARVVPRRESLPASSSFFTRLQLAVADQRLRAIRNVFAAGPWRRVRHWMLSGELSGTKWPAAAAIALFLTGLPLLPQGPEGIVAAAALMSVLLPVFCVAAAWMSRRRSMGYESTRPVPRERFVRELGLAMATDLAEWWLWLTLGALVPVIVWGPPLHVTDVLVMLALSVAEQVLAFGILVSVLRLHSLRASDGSIMTSIIAVVLPVLLTLSIPRTPGMTLGIAAGVAALGAALTYDAYRRWCEMDLV